MTFKQKVSVLFPILLLLASACAPASTPTPTAAPTEVPVPTIHWTYEGEEGPANWGELSPDFAACESGERQSPIDLNGPAQQEQDLPNIVFNYQRTNASIINNGHTIQVNYEPGNSIDVDGVRYELLQFHFHAPSEHSIAGKQAEAEVHLVHRNAEGGLAVVGVMIETGPKNALIQPILDSAPAQPGPAQPLAAQVDPNILLPASPTTYRYDGSLTTPPCTEGVKWLVMTESIQFGEEQLAAFTTLFEGNNRPVQPLNDRAEVEDTSP